MGATKDNVMKIFEIRTLSYTHRVSDFHSSAANLPDDKDFFSIILMRGYNDTCL